MLVDIGQPIAVNSLVSGNAYLGGYMERYKDLVNCCANQPEAVRVWDAAVSDAARDFQINGADTVKQVIGDGGLQQVCFVSERPLELDPRFQTVCFTFMYGPKHGYLSFFKSVRDRWTIKTFKADVSRAELENKPFAGLLSGFQVPSRI